MKKLFTILAVLGLAPVPALSADVLVIPPTRMACGSNYKTQTLNAVTLTARSTTAQIATATITDPSTRPVGVYTFRTTVPNPVTVSTMTLTCSYTTPQGTAAHTLTYNFAALRWPLNAGDAAILRVEITGQVAEATRAAIVNGVEPYLPPPQNLQTAATIFAP